MKPEILNNEKQLIHLISQDDETSFTVLYNHYRNKIYSIALKLTHSTAVAEEIVEDVFLKIWKRRTCLNEIACFRAYLFTVTRNETYRVLKQIAKNYKFLLLNENDESLAISDTDNKLIDKEYSSLLQKAIERLPKQQKQVYKLIKEDELKRAEVAELLNLQPDTVKFHLAQAMKNIRAFCMLHLNMLIGFMILLSSLSGRVPK